ncbi:hypothetical protein ACFPM1_07890 [Halorubrum rubrum]|uniref:Uncharacterized protein n=1 Tax=Halorubrum rubrum TaxID=1126240 RepID=A0ABD5R143_9EURY|nr:hypothetical protein [Halorubrum rubrum]
MRLRNVIADVLEEAARGRRASSSASAAVGRILKHLGVAKAFEATARWIRVDVEEESA